MDADELNDSNSSTPCLLFNSSQHEESVITTALYVSMIVGLLSSILAIVLVLVTRSYLVTIYRIILYLSIAALLFLIIIGMLYIPYVPQDSVTSVYFKIVWFFGGYLPLVYALVLCWIGVHVFLLAVCGVHLQKTKHELFAIVGALLLPLIVTWAIPVYAKRSCAFNNKYLFVLLSLAVPYLISTILAALTVISVILSLCKGLLKIKKANTRALKEIAPFVLFTIVQNITSIFLLTKYVWMYKEGIRKSFVFTFVELLVFAVNFIPIPLLLLSQHHIRSRLKSKICRCKCRGKEEGILPTTTQRQTTVQQSATKPISGSSQTQYCVPPETSFTEEDPLIIKQ